MQHLPHGRWRVSLSLHQQLFSSLLTSFPPFFDKFVQFSWLPPLLLSFSFCFLTFSISSAFFNCCSLTSFSFIFSIKRLRSATSSLLPDGRVLLACLLTTWSSSKRTFFAEDNTGDTKGRRTPLRTSPLNRCNRDIKQNVWSTIYITHVRSGYRWSWTGGFCSICEFWYKPVRWFTSKFLLC